VTDPASYPASPAAASARRGGRSALLRLIFSFRPEEIATLLLFVPMAWALASIAILGGGMPRTEATWNYPDAFTRLVTLAASVTIFLYVVRVKPTWTFARDLIPFLFCANVYANLHDMIAFFGAPDITSWLFRMDVAIFGVEPTIWAQRFAQPVLTDFFTFCYWLFYVLPPLLGLLLYLKGEGRAFRMTLVSIVFCLYLGYVGYVALPAGPPRYAIPEHAFGPPLVGLIAALDASRAAPAALPLTMKGAFPSLHCGVMVLAMLLAWRHLRWFFPIILFFGVGLILGTVYLRHHWVVDIFAGILAALVADRLTPPLETWWQARAQRYAAQPNGAADA